MYKTRRVPGRQSGFTLIELTLVLGVIAILSEAFLPAVQRAREQANRDTADQTLRQTAAYLEDQYKKNGSFPTELNFLPAVQNVGKGGYRMVAVEMKAQRVRLAIEPIAGVTGAFTGVLEVTAGPLGTARQLNFIPTPGADAVRARMLAETRENLAMAFGRILNGELPAVQNNALPQMRSMLDSTIGLRSAFDSVKGADGMLNFASIHNWTQKPFASDDRASMGELWLTLARTMQLGAQGEDWNATPGISEKALNFSKPAAQMLNFAVTADLISRWVADPQTRAAMTDVLERAAAADRTGNLAARQSALTAFTSMLQAQQGFFFPHTGATAPQIGLAESNALIAFARAF